MHPIRNIRRLAAALAALAAALVATATPAFAAEHPPAGSGFYKHPPLPAVHVPIRAVVSGGMPGWQITLIAAAAALLAATFAVLLDRARATRRNAITAAA